VDGALRDGAYRRCDSGGARGEAGGRDQHEAAHCVLMRGGGRDGDGAAERVADEVEALEAEPVDEPAGDLIELEPRAGGLGLAEAGHVDRDYPPSLRQRGDDAVPDEPARRDAVQQHEWLAVAALVAAEQRAPLAVRAAIACRHRQRLRIGA